MPSVVEFVPMLFDQSRGRQVLHRTPEPSLLTDAHDNVIQYDRVMATKLVVAYAAGLETIYRSGTIGTTGGEALDLACGPGHFTLCLARYLKCPRVQGLDLSPPMVVTATKNAAAQGVSERVSFAVADVTRIAACKDNCVDLSCFTDAAHHLPDLSVVTAALGEMERVTRPDGLIFVMDLVRLRTEALTERYVNLLGHDYVERGLANFFEDFRNSMYAAWTAGELRQAVPRDSSRVWCHIVPRGLPTIQFLLGLPVGRSAPFLRSGWRVREHPLIREWYPRWEQDVGALWARETLAEFKMLKLSLRFASRTLLRPAA